VPYTGARATSPPLVPLTLWPGEPLSLHCRYTQPFFIVQFPHPFLSVSLSYTTCFPLCAATSLPTLALLMPLFHPIVICLNSVSSFCFLCPLFFTYGFPLHFLLLFSVPFQVLEGLVISPAVAALPQSNPSKSSTPH
jgi:hypothetical protein